MNKKNIILRLFLFSLIFLLRPSFLTAVGNSSLEQGISLYQRENFDEAQKFLEQARKEDPASTRAAYYLGITEKRLQQYPEAKKNLLDAVTLTPKIKEALPELIEVLYELGDTKEAHRWIAVAEKESVRPAQTAFLRGLVQTKEGKNSEAIKSFTQAKDLDRGLTQVCDYQIGLAYAKGQSYSDAHRAFQEVMALDPNSDISAYADEYSKALDKRAKADKPLHLTAGFFTEWDTNVVLRPGETNTADDIGNEGDFREVVTAGADYTQKFSDAFRLKYGYDLYYANQTDLNDFDVNSHTFTLAPSYNTQNVSYSIPLQYNLTLVDSNELFLSSVTITPQANFKITDRQIGQVGIKFQEKDYYAKIIDGSEDRDGFRVAPGIGWFYLFPEDKGSVGLRYEFDIDNTDGQNWDYAGNRITPSVQFKVPYVPKLKCTLASDLYFQSFRHNNIFFNEKREDQSYTLSSLLSYELTSHFDLQFRYTYVNHKSNIPIYEYDRHVFSTGVVAKF